VFASHGFKAGKFPETIAANGQEKGPYGNGERAGIRTLDPVIKSHVLYQLSYALTWRFKYLNSAGFTSLARLFVPILLD
jgi:hypothetical protein